MRHAELRRLGHENLLEFSRLSTHWGVTGGLREEGGLLLFATGSWIPITCNGAFRVNAEIEPETVVGTADEFFGAIGRGYSLKLRDSGEDDDLRAACEGHGLAVFGAGGPEMVCGQRLPERELPDGVELRVVNSAGELSDFIAVNAEAYAVYGMPPEEVAAVFSDPQQVLSSEGVFSVVAYLANKAVGAAQVVVSGPMAGVYWVGTVERARCRGIGEACTRAVTNMAFDAGAEAVSLQASPMGEPVYRRMGYEPLYRYDDYVRWAS